MATSSKKSVKARKRTHRTSTKAFAGYVKLRTMLDSLEIGALRYYLDNTTDPEKKKRLQQMETQLMPIIRRFWGRERLVNCPRGYTDCDGACVPYACLG